MSQTTLPAPLAADAPERWDHVTVTHGVGGRGSRFRDLALALVLALMVGVVAAWIGAAVMSSRTAVDVTTTSAASHARLGTVVHSNPHAHPRLGPVVGSAAPSPTTVPAATSSEHPRLGTVVHHGAVPRQWKS
jgi:hypothetical protein